MRNGIEYRKLSRKGKCCICGSIVEGNKEKVIHCYNHKSNAGTITICKKCIEHIYSMIQNEVGINE